MNILNQLKSLLLLREEQTRIINLIKHGHSFDQIMKDKRFYDFIFHSTMNDQVMAFEMKDLSAKDLVLEFICLGSDVRNFELTLSELEKHILQNFV